MNPNYQLLEGTNQLIRRHPGQGEQLFKQHGYHIHHPRYRDYYNGMRTGGMQFFDGLGAILLNLFGNHAVNPQLPQANGSGASSLSLSNSAAGSYPLSSIFKNDEFTGGTDYSCATGNGRSNDRGKDNDRGRKQHAYNELLEHLQREAERERLMPIYGIQIPFAPPEQQQTYPAQDLPVHSDTIFGINKKLVFGLALALVIVLYLKFRK